MRRSRFVMIVALLTALIFCVETSAVSAASLSEVRKNIQSKQQEIKDSKEKEQDLSDKIAAMEKQISSKEADISKLEKAIGEAETQLGTLQKQLKEAEAKVDQQDEDLGSRLRNMYKNGSIGFIDVLLDSDNISEFLTNLDMVQKVYSQDQDTLETVKYASPEIDKNKKEIQSRHSELTATKQLVDEENKSLPADETQVEKQRKLRLLRTLQNRKMNLIRCRMKKLRSRKRSVPKRRERLKKLQRPQLRLRLQRRITALPAVPRAHPRNRARQSQVHCHLPSRLQAAS